jgi:3-deoxy-manno-octulosonate cytidylyltransferase (CMP-KDO synthetase)
MKILGVIPSRYASTRFPRKALAVIQGKTMVQRVYEQAQQCQHLERLIVATDHAAIYDHVRSFGGDVMMTSEHHVSGTDRCFETYQKSGSTYDFVINIQGDEPFILPQQISLLASTLHPRIQLATLIKKIDDEENLFNSNSAKVIFNHKKEAIYFSRHPIPFLRGFEHESWLSKNVYYKHIGIYAYRSDVLQAITKLPVSSLEKAESLEQLRWLENGYTINIEVTDLDSFGIDTPQDLENILTKMYKG